MTPAHGQPVIITLPAEIDIANVDTVGEQLAAALTPGTRVVIADMTATTFCDSMGIAMLIHAHKQATANGAELRLLLPCPDVLRVLRIHGVDAVLPIYHSLEEALATPGDGRRNPGPRRPARLAPGHARRGKAACVPPNVPPGRRQLRTQIVCG